MTVSSSSGTKVFIHPPVSATNARYLDQLSDWVEIGEVENIDEIGETFGVVQRTFFGNGPRTEHLKTVATGSAVSVSIGRDYDDSGQSILNDALSSRDSYLFKVELNDARFVGYANSRLIFRALVLVVNTAVGGNDNIVRCNATLQINSEIYELPSEPQSDAIASLSLDFMNNRASVVGPNSPLFQPVSEVVTDTHATDILALSSAGYETFGPNVLPRTDLGLLTTVTQTNLFLNSDAPATQSVTISPTTVHTVRVWGSGSITLSGAATGTVEEGSPVTFTSSGTSLTLTVSGTLDYVMLVAGSFATDPIITEGSAVTRPGNMPVIDLTGRLGGVTAGVTALRPNTAGVLFLLNDGTFSNLYGLARGEDGSLQELHSIGGTATATNVGVGSTGRLVVAYALAEGYHRMEVIGLGDTGPLTHSLPPLDRKHYGSIGLSTANNMYGVTEQDAMIFSATDPAAAFAQVRALAQEWAAQ